MKLNTNSIPDGTYYTTGSQYSGLSQTSRFRGYKNNNTGELTSMFPISEMMHKKKKQK